MSHPVIYERLCDSDRYPIVLDSEAGMIGCSIHEAEALAVSLIRVIREARQAMEKRMYPRIIIKEVK